MTVGYIRPDLRTYPTVHIESEFILFSPLGKAHLFNTRASLFLPSHSSRRAAFQLSYSPKITATNMPAPVAQPKTLYDKIWDDHVVYVHLVISRTLCADQLLAARSRSDIDENGLALIYIDRCVPR